MKHIYPILFTETLLILFIMNLIEGKIYIQLAYVIQFEDIDRVSNMYDASYPPHYVIDAVTGNLTL